MLVSRHFVFEGEILNNRGRYLLHSVHDILVFFQVQRPGVCGFWEFENKIWLVGRLKSEMHYKIMASWIGCVVGELKPNM